MSDNRYSYINNRVYQITLYYFLSLISLLLTGLCCNMNGWIFVFICPSIQLILIALIFSENKVVVKFITSNEIKIETDIVFLGYLKIPRRSFTMFGNRYNVKIRVIKDILSKKRVCISNERNDGVNYIFDISRCCDPSTANRIQCEINNHIKSFQDQNV